MVIASSTNELRYDVVYGGAFWEREWGVMTKVITTDQEIAAEASGGSWRQELAAEAGGQGQMVVVIKIQTRNSTRLSRRHELAAEAGGGS